MSKSISKTALLSVAISAVLSSAANAGTADGMIAFWAFNSYAAPAESEKSVFSSSPVSTILPASFLSDSSGKALNLTAIGANVGGLKGSVGSSTSSRKTDYVNFSDSNTDSYLSLSEAGTTATTTNANSVALRLGTGPYTISVWSRLSATALSSALASQQGMSFFPVISKPGWRLSYIAAKANSVFYFNGTTATPSQDSVAVQFCINPVPPTMTTATCVASPLMAANDPNISGWNHTVITFDATAKKASLYLNKNLVAIKGAATPATSAFPSPVATAAGPLFVGQGIYGVGAYGNFFRGDIDNIRIYNRLLTDIERRELDVGCGFSTYDPKTGKVSIPCVALNVGNGSTSQNYYYQASLQQAVSAGGDINIPKVDELSFSVASATPILPTATNPEPVWGRYVSKYLMNDITVLQASGDPTGKKVATDGVLMVNGVSITNPIGILGSCYDVSLSSILATGRFMFITDTDYGYYLGGVCQ